MSVTGIDIAWAKPSIASIKATGAKWVARYSSTDPTKDLTAAEVKSYPANDLAIVLVRETTTGRATAGHAAGISDAHAADAERAKVGLPANMVIHFAVDEDTSWAHVADYFDGVLSVLGKARTGLYGGYAVVEGAAAHGIKYLWQTTAWSGGKWSVHATIRQTGGTTLSGGADFDYAEIADFGQFPRPAVVVPKPPAPKPPVKPTPPPSTGGTDLPTPQEVWAYKGPGDAPDVHQTVQNIATEVAAIKTGLATVTAIKTELDAVKAAVAGLVTQLTALAGAGSVTSAEIQSGITAELHKLSLALGGLK